MAAAVASCFAGGAAFANPTGPTVANGAVSFNQQGNLLQITNSPNAIINWQSFSIGANEITRFLQQSASSAVLNRVVSQNPSAILGALQSNGRVFLINPNGILFGAGAQIDVAGLVASTLNFSDADFLAGRLRFTEVPGAGSVVNQGSITAGQGGSVYLVGPAVTNSGVVTSPKGEVILAAGNTVELVDPGTPNLRVEITAPDNQALNLGQIVADSGRIGIYAGLINHSGRIRANSAVVTESGQVLLKATKGVTLDENSVTSASGPRGGTISVQTETGTIRVAGQLDATGSETAGGAINIAVTGAAGGIDLGTGLNAGNAAVSLNGPGHTLTLNADIITAGVPISLDDSVILGAPGTITLDTTNGGAVPTGLHIVITGTVNDDATPSGLVLRAGTIGVVSLMGAVGDTTPIQGLTVESANVVRLPSVNTREGGVHVTTLGAFPGPFIRLGGNIDTTRGAGSAGNVSLTGPVRLGADVQITTDHATGADGSVSFVGAASTINPDPLEPGLRSLTMVAGSGDVIFGGAVGNTEALQGLTVSSANDVSLGAVTTRDGGLSVVTTDAAGDPASNTLSGNLSTTAGVNAGNVSLTGPVTLAADVAIMTDHTTGADGNVSFVGSSSTVNADATANNRALQLAAGSGSITFGGAVGMTQALGSLTASGNTIAVDGGSVITTGPQSYTGGVTLGAPTTFSATGAAGSITFNTSLAAGANDVTLSAREIDLPGTANMVSGMGTITLQPDADGTPIVIGAAADSGAATLDVTDSDIAALANGFSLITIGRSGGAHAITVDSSGASFKDAVTIRALGAGGSITVNGMLTTAAAADPGAITLNGPGATTTLNADIVTAGGSITISDSVTLGTPATVMLDTTASGVPAGASISIAGTVGDDTVGTSGFVLNAGTGGTITFSDVLGAAAALASLTATGNQININGGSVTTTGDQSYTGAVTLSAPATVLTGSLMTFNGTLRPGGSGAVGTLTVVGNATFGSTGVIEIEAQGAGAGQHDVVAVTGTASLGGQLNVSNIGSYVPANGDTYVPVTFASATGIFTVNPADTYTETYNPTNLTLVFGTVDLINRWIGTSGNWATASNWSLGHAPTGTETVLIDVPGLETVTVSGGERAAHMLTSNENFTIRGGSLDLGGASTFNATLTLSGGKLRGAGDVVVNGDFNWKGGKLMGPGTFTTNGTSTLAPRHGSLQLKRDWINLGTVQWVARHGRDLFIREGATFLNAAGGTLNLKAGNGSDIRGEGELINEGTINKNGGKKISIRAEFSNAGTLNVNRGTLRLKWSAGNDGVINIGRHATLDLHGHRYTNRGLITGTGTLDVHGVRFTNDGVVAPGGAGGAGIGTLTIDGNYHQGANGVLLMDLGGTAAGQHDVLAITGKAFLGGTLSVNAVGSYVPMAGDAFRLITYRSRSGAFATTVAPAGFDLSSAYQKKFARFTLVPE